MSSENCLECRYWVERGDIHLPACQEHLRSAHPIVADPISAVELIGMVAPQVFRYGPNA